MDKTDAIDALRQLGLSKYEAEVFVALQKLTISTARDVARCTNVPRSQVYGAAESLEERGLIEVHRSDPIQYRAVDLDEAQARLRRSFERTQTRAFDFLETVEGTYTDGHEKQEAIWTLRGRDTVVDRVTQIIHDADASVVYGFGAELSNETITDALVEQAARDVDVTVTNTDRSVIDAFENTPVRTVRLPADLTRDEWGGRLLVADGDTVLMSVPGVEERPRIREEMAFWSSKTGFATVLVRLIDGWFGPHLEL